MTHDDVIFNERETGARLAQISYAETDCATVWESQLMPQPTRLRPWEVEAYIRGATDGATAERQNRELIRKIGGDAHDTRAYIPYHWLKDDEIAAITVVISEAKGTDDHPRFGTTVDSICVNGNHFLVLDHNPLGTYVVGRVEVGNMRAPVSPSIRDEVAKRHNHLCVYCGSGLKPAHNDGRDMHVDHLLPISRGGTDDLSNLVAACAPCNISKKDKTLAELWSGRSGPELKIVSGGQ